MQCVITFTGHGNAVNELQIHPKDNNLLLSASKDYALRLWNTKTAICVAIFGGVDGHRDKVLSAIIPYLNQEEDEDMSFPILEVHFLKYLTHEIYRNYIDCVRWFS
uniref:Uncharacterized protein n=1 Tax=Amphimedon queenslandica TaxID=400682 RepID=A0A1X7SVT1_AMPQE